MKFEEFIEEVKSFFKEGGYDESEIPLDSVDFDITDIDGGDESRWFTVNCTYIDERWREKEEKEYLLRQKLETIEAKIRKEVGL
jgi:hypothetical protein